MFFGILLVIAMIATLLSLGFGLFSFFKGGEFNKKYGNRAMQMRIVFQTVALVLFAILLTMGKQ